MADTKGVESKLELLISLLLDKQSMREVSQNISESIVEGEKLAAEDERTMVAIQKIANKYKYAFKGDTSGVEDPNTKAALQITGEASKASSKIGDDIMKIMKTGIGIIEDIHARIKQASPLLQSVESLFNLAMQLFFMPLGNKLAQVMLPAILELVDNVMAMWDKIEGMDLGDMLTAMIDYGAKIFGEYFTHLGEDLADQSGIIGSLGRILTGLGDFIENHLADLIEMGVKILQFVMDNFGTLINAFIEFKILSLSLQAAQLATQIGIATGIPGLGSALGVAALATGEVAGHAVVGSSGIYEATSKMNNRAASGAYVGAVEGGRDVTVAEGGEGEFILPESRLQSMMDSVSDRMVNTAAAPTTELKSESSEPTNITNNFYITGYTDRELKDIIRQTVNEQVSQGRLRSGF